MPIIVYCGPSCSGKSTHIKKNFPNAKVFDLFEYQQKYPLLTLQFAIEAQNQSIKDVCKYACEHPEETVVYEQTFLREIRRSEFLAKVKEFGYTGDVILYAMCIDIETHKKQMKLRSPNLSDACIEFEITNANDTYEIPTKNEKFKKIIIVTEKGEKIL